MAITYEKNKNTRTYQPKNKELKMYFYAALFFAPIALCVVSFILSKAETFLGVNFYSQSFIYLSFLLLAFLVIFFAVHIFKVKAAGGVRSYFFIKKIKNKIYKNLLDSKLVNVQYYDFDKIELPNINIDVTLSEINVYVEVLPGFDDIEQLSTCITIAFNEGKYKGFVVVESYKKSNGLTYAFTLEDVGKSLSLTPRQVKDLIVDEDDAYKFLLQKDTIWNINVAPHMILSGKTGAGKSTLLYSLILQIFYKGLDVYIVDPKNEFRSFSSFFSNIYSTKEEVIELLRTIVEVMEAREKEVNRKAVELNKVSISAYDIGLKPMFIIIDEYSSLVASMDKKEKKEFDDLITILIQRGRSTGTILIAAMQNANSESIRVAIRNQFGARILLGDSSKEDIQFIFGSGVDNLSLKVERYTGYYYLTGMVAPKKLFLPNIFKYELNKLDNFKNVYLQNKNNSHN